VDHESIPAVETESIEQHYDAYRQEVQRLGDESYDIYMRAFYKRLDIEHDTNPDFDQEIRIYMDLRDRETVALRASKIFRAAQFLVIPPLKGHEPSVSPNRPRDPGYPRGRSQPAGWDDVFQLLKDSERDQLEFTMRLWGGEIQSNVHERATAIHAAARLFDLRQIQAYTGGHSMGNVEKALALNSLSRFNYSRVLVGTPHVERRNGIQISRSRTRQYNELLHDRELWVSRVVGVDLMLPVRDPQLMDWARSCSSRPEEFLNEKRRHAIEQLMRIEPMWFHHMGDDYSDDGHLERLYAKFPWLQEQRPNLAIHSFSLYQDNDEERQRTYANVEQVLDPEQGVHLVLDFVERNDDGELEFDNQDRGWMTRLYAKDMANKDAGWQHILTAKDGRVKQVMISDEVPELAPGAMRRKAA
jgi:hypothetical protein